MASERITVASFERAVNQIMIARLQHAIIVARFRNAYRAASRKERREAINWYRDANQLAQDIARAHEGVSVDTAARVIAVISPRLSWGSNVACAHAIVAHWEREQNWEDLKIQALPKNIEKAFLILDGRPEFLRGPKVNAFYENIISSGQSGPPTIDNWMIRIATGARERIYHNTPTKAQREAIESALREACKRYSRIALANFQAVIWVSFRAQLATAKELAAYEKRGA